MEDPCAISDREFTVFPVCLRLCPAVLSHWHRVSEKAEGLGFCQANLKEGGRAKGLNRCVRGEL